MDIPHRRADSSVAEVILHTVANATQSAVIAGELFPAGEMSREDAIRHLEQTEEGLRQALALALAAQEVLPGWPIETWQDVSALDVAQAINSKG